MTDYSFHKDSFYPNLIVNPGIGSIEGSNKEDAIQNLNQLLEDADLKKVVVEYIREEDGRFYFMCSVGHMFEVGMPGLPLNQVRYMKEPSQNIWDFPRLYIDGSSWIWYYAISIIRGEEYYVWILDN